MILGCEWLELTTEVEKSLDISEASIVVMQRRTLSQKRDKPVSLGGVSVKESAVKDEAYLIGGISDREPVGRNGIGGVRIPLLSTPRRYPVFWLSFSLLQLIRIAVVDLGSRMRFNNNVPFRNLQARFEHSATHIQVYYSSTFNGPTREERRYRRYLARKDLRVWDREPLYASERSRCRADRYMIGSE